MSEEGKFGKVVRPNIEQWQRKDLANLGVTPEEPQPDIWEGGTAEDFSYPTESVPTREAIADIARTIIARYSDEALLLEDAQKFRQTFEGTRDSIEEMRASTQETLEHFRKVFRGRDEAQLAAILSEVASPKLFGPAYIFAAAERYIALIG